MIFKKFKFKIYAALALFEKATQMVKATKKC